VIGRLAQIVGDLRGDGATAFRALLAAQLDAAILATEVIAEGLRDGGRREASTRRLQELEHEGDRLRGLLVHELGLRIATPIDREDLFRLSRSLDDILDNLRDFQREEALFEPVPSTVYVPILAAAATAIRELHGAVEALPLDANEISRRSRAARRAGNQVRRLYDDALSELFAAHLSMETLKQRELLRRLDVVGLRLREAADVLADAAVKRGGSF
jgi:uncharacterized protein Yka (UPF0111/DUF47 family)